MRRLEEELGDIGNAIRKMHSGLQQSLQNLSEVNRQQTQLIGESAQTGREILHANQQGFTATTTATATAGEQVTQSVQQQTDAQVQVKYLQLYNEAKEPCGHIVSLADDIEERFLKALEGVHTNRELYDEHFAQIIDGYEQKIAQIGAHIHEVMEGCFEPVLEGRVRVPLPAYRAIGCEVDEARTEIRAERLDGELMGQCRERLEKLLQQHDHFEAALRERFAIADTVPVGPVDLPGFICETSGETEVCFGARVDRTPGDGAVRFAVGQDPRYAGVSARAKAAAGPDLLRYRPATDDERSELQQNLVKLAEQGLIDRDLLPGWFDYIQKFGFSVGEPADERARVGGGGR